MRTDEPAKTRKLDNRKRSNAGAAGIAEFVPTLAVLFLITFPLINLLGVICGYSCAALAAWQGARQASVAYALSQGLQAMAQESNKITGSGFGAFAKMKPVKGYSQSGADLYIRATNIYTGKTTTYGPNIGVPAPIDISSNIYECSACATFDVGPLVPMTFVPGLKDAPGLGCPARFSITWDRAAEHPEGLLDALQDPTLLGGSSDIDLGSMLSSNPMNALKSSGWNHPTIYEKIKAAGKEVVFDDVLQINSRDFLWTDTGATYNPGDSLWIDFRAEGLWSAGVTNYGYYDANGDADGGALFGKVGGLPQPSNSDPTFTVGVSCLNYQPSGSGKVYLRIDDDLTNDYLFTDNDGLQTVRVIVAR